MTKQILCARDLYPYQFRGIRHIVEHVYGMLWVDMGLGKTAMSLYAFRALQNRWEAAAMLVVGPKRVMEGVWRQEGEKWIELQDLRFSLINGPENERKRALARRADVYLIGYSNLEWLVTWIRSHYLGQGQYPPFDMLVYDEVTRVKNPETRRSVASQLLIPYMRRRVGLTGEPAANGYKDLFGQYLAVDGGTRLGTEKQAFQDAFLQIVNRRAVVTRYGKEQIKERIHDITLEMAAEDYLDLPPVVERNLTVDLPPQARAIYDEVEASFFAELDDGAVIEAQTEATKNMKCLQISGGACYVDNTDRWNLIHNAKLDLLEEIIEEQGGSPVLLAYAFKHEVPRIQKRFPEAKFLSSNLPEREFNRIQNAWNAGEIPLLCGHPASMGHGLNLQYGGSTLCWFGLNWSLELYRQFNARLTGGLRRNNRVFLYRLLTRNTLDEAVLAALENKAQTQADLRATINEYRRQRGL